MDKNNGYGVVKVIVLFLICTVIFYTCFRVLQVDYDQNYRYDMPEGPSVKVHRSK